MKTKIICIAMLALAGCTTTPVNYTTAPMSTYDKNTEYAVEDRAEGFDVTVSYNMFQFIAESEVAATACKSALTNIAWDTAKKRKREIDPINEQRIRISMGRNEWTGNTSCSATTPVKWK